MINKSTINSVIEELNRGKNNFRDQNEKKLSLRFTMNSERCTMHMCEVFSPHNIVFFIIIILVFTSQLGLYNYNARIQAIYKKNILKNPLHTILDLIFYYYYRQIIGNLKD
jgi:hypothetical protein